MHRSRALLVASLTVTLASLPVNAQEAKIPVKQLGAAEAKTAQPIGNVNMLRALRDGSVYINDGSQRRLLLLDSTLKVAKVVADTNGKVIPYGQRQIGLLSFAGDSTVMVDPATLTLLVLNNRGEIARIMSMPRPQDFNLLASSNLGANAFDSKGRLIYRAFAQQGGGNNPFGGRGNPGGGRGGPGGGGGGGGGGQGGQQGRGGQQGGQQQGGQQQGGQQQGGQQQGRGGQAGGGGGQRGGGGGGEDFPGGRPGGPGGPDGFGGQGGGRGGRGQAQPDSVPILRANFDTRKTDTVTFVKVPKNEFVTTQLPDGGTRMTSKINPLPQGDDWALLSDGTVAVVRVLDYHIDWYTPDGKHAASEKLPFDWKRLTDDDKVKLIDSLKTAAKEATERAQAMIQGGQGNFRIGFEPVAPEQLPDYFPPIRQGSTHADMDGNLWILPATSTIALELQQAMRANAPGGRGGRGGGAAGDSAGRGGRGAGSDSAARPATPPPPPVAPVSLVYDVVNRKGELVERVQLPAGRTIAGFGPNGAVYLSVREGRNLFVERYRR